MKLHLNKIKQISLTLFIILIIIINSSCEYSFALLNENVDDKEIIYNNFNSMPIGETPSNFIVKEKEGDFVVSNFPSSYNRSLMFDDTSIPGGIDVDYIIPEQYEDLVIEIDFCSLQNSHVFTLKLQDSLHVPALIIQLDSDGKIIYYYNANDFADINYIPDMWYNLKIETDIQGFKYRIYVDENLIDEVNFVNEVSSIDRVNFKSDYFNPGTVYIDNILLY